jgi:hypothetical protein
MSEAMELSCCTVGTPLAERPASDSVPGQQPPFEPVEALIGGAAAKTGLFGGRQCGVSRWWSPGRCSQSESNLIPDSSSANDASPYALVPEGARDRCRSRPL